MNDDKGQVSFGQSNLAHSDRKQSHTLWTRNKQTKPNPEFMTFALFHLFSCKLVNKASGSFNFWFFYNLFLLHSFLRLQLGTGAAPHSQCCNLPRHSHWLGNPQGLCLKGCMTRIQAQSVLESSSLWAWLPPFIAVLKTLALTENMLEWGLPHLATLFNSFLARSHHPLLVRFWNQQLGPDFPSGVVFF